MGTRCDVRGRGARLWLRMSGVTAGLMLLSAAGTGILQAQCALAVTAQRGETGYRKRDYGCEGLYVQLQAASINIQVISLVRGDLNLGSSEVEVSVPARLPAELNDTVRIIGRGRHADVNWALDWYARPDSPLTWPLDAVLHKVPIDASRVGVFGRTTRKSGLGGPVYVPVDVRAPGEGVDEAARPVELVLRIPLAGSAQWRLGGGGEWTPAKPYNGDGFFAFELPPAAGVADFEIRWSPRGKREFGAPESLRILFW